MIDELAANPANNVPVPPPDIYTHFQNNSTTEYSAAGVEPNGLGYQSIAQIWLQVLTQ